MHANPLFAVLPITKAKGYTNELPASASQDFVKIVFPFKACHGFRFRLT